MKNPIEEIKWDMSTKVAKHQYGFWNYWPLIAPVADSDELASLGPRLMLRHGSPTRPDLEIFVAPENELTSGWVIGVCFVISKDYRKLA